MPQHQTMTNEQQAAAPTPPPGFKNTKLGLLPVDWEVVRLKDIAIVQTGIAKGKKDQTELIELPYLRVANVQDGYLDLSKVKTIKLPLSKKDRFLLQYGDVLMTEGGDYDKLGRGTIWRNEIEDCLHQNHVFAVRPLTNKITSYFLSSYGASEKGKNYFKSCSKQSTNLASINSTQLKSMPIPLPPLAEQTAIANCLSAWDRAITTTRELIETLKSRKKGLMQQLLTGERRLPGVEGEWRNIKLGDITRRITDKNEELDDTVVTISAQRGFVKQEDYFNKRVASKTLSGYYLIKRGHFAYNKSYSKGYPMGAFKRLDNYNKAVVTTLYICFEVLSNTDSDFLLEYFEAGLLNKNLTKIAQEGGRAHGLLNIGLKDFFNLNLKLPPLPEQTAIAAVLTAADREISLHETRLATLLAQKKGLMQQLLTGKKRLPL